MRFMKIEKRARESDRRKQNEIRKDWEREEYRDAQTKGQTKRMRIWERGEKGEKGSHFSMASKETTEEQRQVNIKSDE